MKNRYSVLLAGLLFATSAGAQTTPHRDFTLQWNSPSDVYVEVNQYDTIPLRCYTYQGTSSWSSTGWVGYMRWAASKSDMQINGGVTVTGISQNTYFDFIPVTNTFSKVFTTAKPGYIEIYFSLPASNQTATIASGSLVVNDAPGKNANGKLASTFAIVGDSYGPFTGSFTAWPFVLTNGVGGSYITVGNFNTYSSYVASTFHKISDFNTWSNAMATYTNWSVTNFTANATFTPWYTSMIAYTNWSLTNFNSGATVSDLNGRYEATSNLLNSASNALNASIGALEDRYEITSNIVYALSNDMVAVMSTNAQDRSLILAVSNLHTALRTDYAASSNLLNEASNTLNTALAAGDTIVSNAVVTKMVSDLATYSNHAVTAFMPDFTGTYAVVYSDGSGNKQEVQLGAVNTVLSSAGPSQAPRWSTVNSISAISFTNDFVPNTSNTYDIGSATLPIKGLHFGVDGATHGLFFEGVQRISRDATSLDLDDTVDIAGDLNVTSNIDVNGYVDIGTEKVTNWHDVALYWNYNDISNQVWVSKEGNDANDGKSPEKPKLTIGDAINDHTSGASPGLRINVGPGVYAEAITIPVNVAVVGSGAGKTVITNSSSITVTLNGTNACLADVTAVCHNPDSTVDNAVYLAAGGCLVERCTLEIQGRTVDLDNLGVLRLVGSTIRSVVRDCEIGMYDATVTSATARDRTFVYSSAVVYMDMFNCRFLGDIKDNNDNIYIIWAGVATSVVNIFGCYANITPNAVSAAGTEYAFYYDNVGPGSKSALVGNYCRLNGSGGTSGDAMFLKVSTGDVLIGGNIFDAGTGWQNAWGIELSAGDSVLGDSAFYGVTNIFDPASAGSMGVLASNYKQEWFRYQNTTGHFEFTSNGVFTLAGTIGTNWIPAVSNSYTLGSATAPWKDLYVSTGSIYFVQSDVSLGVNTNGNFEYRSSTVTNTFGENVHAQLYMDSPGHSQVLTGTYATMTNWTEYTNAYAPATVNATVDPILGTIVPTHIGWLKVFGNFSFGTVAAEDVEFDLHMDGVSQPHMEITSKTAVADNDACSFSGRLYIPSTTNILTIKAKVVDGAGTITPAKAQFLIEND